MKLSLALPSPEDSRIEAKLERWLKEISAWGYEGVEFLVNDPNNVDVGLVRGLLGKYNLSLSGLRTGLAYLREGLSFSDPSRAVRMEAVRRIREDILFAADFGAAVLIGLMQGKLQDHVSLKQARKWIVESLKECAQSAEERKVIIALEPVNRNELNYHNTVDDIKQIIDETDSKNVLLLIDTFHIDIEEASICEAIISSKDYLGHVHFADRNRSVPGKGGVDFPEIVRTLKEIGYDGWITLEIDCNPDFDIRAGEGIDYLNKIITNEERAKETGVVPGHRHSKKECLVQRGRENG